MAHLPGCTFDSAAFDGHLIRITSHGKIQAWVDYALRFFEQSGDRPLIFHTGAVPKTALVAEHPSSRDIPADDQEGPAELETQSSTRSMIPRLISVVEIVKREYLKKLDTSLAQEGHLSGLHQYNEVFSVPFTENRPLTEPSSTSLRSTTYLTPGKKLIHMKITLCREQLSSLPQRNETYQKPTIRRLSKAARARTKRRSQKNSAL